MSKGFPGQPCFGSEPRSTYTARSVDAIIKYGVAITVGAGYETCRAGTLSTNTIAFALRESNSEAFTRPSDGSNEYVLGDAVSVMRQGTLYVLVTKTPAVRNQPCVINKATGEISGGTAVAGEVNASNAVFLESGAVGDVIKVRVDIIQIIYP